MTSVSKKRRNNYELDSLTEYIRAAEAYPIPSRDDLDDMVIEWQETQSPRLADRIARAVGKLMVKLANHYMSATRDIYDLVAAANIGLVHAMRRFDASQDMAFSTYAAMWAKAYMAYELWYEPMVRLPMSYRACFLRVVRERDRVLHEHGVATTELVVASAAARGLELEPSKVEVILDWLVNGQTVPGDAPYRHTGSDGGDLAGNTPFEWFFLNDEPTAEHALVSSGSNARVRQAVNTSLARLPPKARDVLTRRLLQGQSFDKICAELGGSKQNYQQMYSRHLDNVRGFLRHNLSKARAELGAHA